MFNTCFDFGITFIKIDAGLKWSNHDRSLIRVGRETFLQLAFNSFFKNCDCNLSHTIDDYSAVMNLPLSEEYLAEHWKDDAFYGYQFLNGVHPSMIRNCRQLPSNFPVTEELVQPFLEAGTSLQQEIQVCVGVQTTRLHVSIDVLTSVMCHTRSMWDIQTRICMKQILEESLELTKPVWLVLSKMSPMVLNDDYHDISLLELLG